MGQSNDVYYLEDIWEIGFYVVCNFKTNNTSPQIVELSLPQTIQRKRKNQIKSNQINLFYPLIIIGSFYNIIFCKFQKYYALSNDNI